MKVIEKSKSSENPHDARFMAAALSLASRASGRVWPNPAVGALIVDESDYIPVVRGRGWTQATGGAHAEVRALHDAGEAAQGATCYVTLEPCSHQGRTGPCAVALAEAGIKRVVVAIADPNPRVSGRGVEILRQAGVEVIVGVCEGQAAEHHAGFIRRMRDGRPHVILKLAVSSDGFIGRRGDGQVAITGEDVKRRVHLFRAECDAIMVGIGTAIADNPSLTCRLPGLEERSPVRVVLDPRADLPLSSKLARTAGETPVWVVVANDADYERTDALSEKGCSVIRVAPDGRGRISPKVALRALGQRGITKLLLEGGSRIAKSFVEADAVDEAMIYNGAAMVGGGGILPFGERGLDFLDESALEKAPGRIQVGPESCDHYIRRGK